MVPAQKSIYAIQPGTAFDVIAGKYSGNSFRIIRPVIDGEKINDQQVRNPANSKWLMENTSAPGKLELFCLDSFRTIEEFNRTIKFHD